MLRIPGKQPNSFKYFYDGHFFHVDNRNGLIYRCSDRNRGCPVTLYSDNFNIEHANINKVHDHNHAIDPHLLLKSQFSQEIFERVRTSFEDPKIIFDSVLNKDEYRELRNIVDYYRQYRTIMFAERRKYYPPLPADLEELGQLINETYRPMQQIYKGCVTGDDGSRAIIFIHPEMMQALAECTQLFCDGTFKGFPAVFILTTAKTQNMYDAIWDKLIELIPELRQNITGITSDFERAQISSAKNKFPDARVSGCLFHFKQALIKKWTKLRIPVAYEYILEKAYALAHLPAESIPEGIAHITQIVDSMAARIEINAADVENLQTFSTYLRTYWLPLKDIFSVFGKPVRSNNTCENFHMYASKRFGQKTNLYKFLDCMSAEMQKIAIDYEKAKNGLRITRHRPRELINTDIEIFRAERELEARQYTVVEFLNVIAAQRRFHLARVFLYNDLINQPQDQERNDIEQIDDHFELQDVVFFRDNMDANTGPGAEFENVVVIRHRRRILPIRDNELMPVQPAQPIRRRGRPRGIREAINDNENVPPRRRGRPRRQPNGPPLIIEQNEPANPPAEENLPGIEPAADPFAEENVPGIEQVDPPAEENVHGIEPADSSAEEYIPGIEPENPIELPTVEDRREAVIQHNIIRPLTPEDLFPPPPPPYIPQRRELELIIEENVNPAQVPHPIIQVENDVLDMNDEPEIRQQNGVLNNIPADVQPAAERRRQRKKTRRGGKRHCNWNIY